MDNERRRKPSGCREIVVRELLPLALVSLALLGVGVKLLNNEGNRVGGRYVEWAQARIPPAETVVANAYAVATEIAYTKETVIAGGIPELVETAEALEQKANEHVEDTVAMTARRIGWFLVAKRLFGSSATATPIPSATP